MGSKITQVEYYLPDLVYSNNDIEKEFPDWPSNKTFEKTGILERRFAAENQTSLDLAVEVCKSLLNDFDKNKIDLVLFCTESPDYYMPSNACIIQNKLGLRNNIGAFDFNLGCSGFVYGLAIAKSFINSGLVKTVLLITAETYSKFIHPLDKSNKIIFGDAASATIIEINDEEHILKFSLGTDGAGFNKIIVPNGGLRKKYDNNAEELKDIIGNIRTDNNLFMNGIDVFNFTIKTVPKLTEEILLINGLAKDNIDYYIFHQPNEFMLEHLRKKINIPKDKFYMDIKYTGNTISSTIPIAISESLKKGTVKQGDLILIEGFGVGYSWGGTIIKI